MVDQGAKLKPDGRNAGNRRTSLACTKPLLTQNYSFSVLSITLSLNRRTCNPGCTYPNPPPAPLHSAHLFLTALPFSTSLSLPTQHSYSIPIPESHHQPRFLDPLPGETPPLGPFLSTSCRVSLPSLCLRASARLQRGGGGNVQK